MAIRTDLTALGLTLGSTGLSDQVLSQCITDANLMVDDLLAGAGGSAAELEKIERLLAAHNATAREPLVTERKMEGVTEKLKVVDFWQLAVQADSTGILAALPKPGTRRAGFYVMPQEA